MEQDSSVGVHELKFTGQMDEYRVIIDELRLAADLKFPRITNSMPGFFTNLLGCGFVVIGGRLLLVDRRDLAVRNDCAGLRWGWM
jgi:hypothetical protein